MAFKRTNFKSLTNTNKARFSSDYRFSKKASFEVGKDAYIILLGLESGYFETPCHQVKPHKVNGKMIGFNNSSFATYIKCKGVDENGNRKESLCCTLAQLEKERIPDKEESAKRIISFTGYRVHLPVLILGNSLGDKNKGTYPVSKVSILNDLRSEKGLNFAYIEMASSSFKNEILSAYGKKLKEEGILDYEMEETSEEFMQEVCNRLSKTVIKVHGISKTGFQAALKEYSFFPFDNPSIASASPEGEREAIIGYKDNQEIQNKICEFLDLFNIEVDNMFNDWSEKDLQEYYNSAIGVDLKSSMVDKKVTNETSNPDIAEAEIIEEIGAKDEEPSKAVEKLEQLEQEEPTREPISDEEMDKLLKDPFAEMSKTEVTDELDSFDLDEDDEFFSE